MSEYRLIRVAVASHRPERGKRYSPSLKQRIVEFVALRHAEGASWATIASELGMSGATLRVWRFGPTLFIEGCTWVGRRALSPDAIEPSPLGR
jgi:hypothetical protein